MALHGRANSATLAQSTSVASILRRATPWDPFRKEPAYSPGGMPRPFTPPLTRPYPPRLWGISRRGSSFAARNVALWSTAARSAAQRSTSARCAARATRTITSTATPTVAAASRTPSTARSPRRSRSRGSDAHQGKNRKASSRERSSREEAFCLWAQRDLNPRLQPCEGRTLPLSYAPDAGRGLLQRTGAFKLGQRSS